MSTIVLVEPRVSSTLRQRFWVFGVFCLGLLAAGYVLLRSTWGSAEALRWLGLATPAMGFVLWRLWSSLGENYRQGEGRLLPELGAGNVISLGRGALIATLYGFLFSARPQGWLAWLPGIIYTVATLMDFADGAAARLSNHVTRLGEILDISFDGLGMLVVTALLVQYGQVPAWFLLLGLARTIFLAGILIRRRLGLPVYDLPPSNFRRILAGFTFGFTFVLLWPLFGSPGTLWAAAFWALPFLMNFLVDWLTVSGALKPDFRASISRFTHFVTTWLPIFLRGLSVLLSGKGIYLHLMNGTSTPYLNPWQYFLESHLVWLDLVVLLALALGAAGRVFAFAGLFLLGVHQLFAPLDQVQHLLIYVYISLVFLGSGAYSLWRPEDRLLNRRVGERQS